MYLSTNLRIHLVEFLGFCNTLYDDAKIFREQSSWLASSYFDSIRFSGILQFEHIASPRMTDMRRLNLETMKAACGEIWHANGTLLSSMCNMVAEDVIQERENELAKYYWGSTLDGGGVVMRFHGDKSSALKILHSAI